MFVVMRRELEARVRTRAFILSTVLLPVFIVLVSVLPALLSRGGNRTLRIALVDATTNGLGPQLETALRNQTLQRDSASMPRYDLVRVQTDERSVASVRDSLVRHTGQAQGQDQRAFDGVLVINDSALTTGNVVYLGTNTSAFETMGQLESTVSRVMVSTRLSRAGIDPTVMAHVMSPQASLQTIKVSDGKATGESGTTSFFIAYFMGFILYFTMIIYGQQTLTSVIEEKTSRIMEVLMSSLRPFEMLMGKILGVGATGLLQLSIWGVTIYLVSSHRMQLAHAFGVSADAVQQFPIPSMPPSLLAVFLSYFVLGFLLYGAVYAAIGSMFNAVNEAQQVAMFVQMAIMVGFFTLFAVIKDPTGSLGVTMSMIPFFSPFIMPARWSLTSVPPAQLAASLMLSVLALLAMTWLAGRIYRTGILMYGKKPSLLEVARWIRA